MEYSVVKINVEFQGLGEIEALRKMFRFQPEQASFPLSACTLDQDY